MISLGQRIRELRIKQDMNQTDLAKGLCTPSMISQIESDRARPSYTMLSMLAERLATPLDKLLSEVDVNIDTVSTYKIAQTMMASGSHAAAIPLLQELLPKKISVPIVQVQLSLVECYVGTTHYEQAESVLSEVEETARLHTDPLLQAAVLQYTGIIARQRHLYQLAIFHWLQALKTLGTSLRPDPELEVRLLTNLAEAYEKTGHMQLALKYQSQAVERFAGMDNFQEVGHTYLQMSHSYKALHDTDRAAEYADRARGVFWEMSY